MVEYIFRIIGVHGVRVRIAVMITGLGLGLDIAVLSYLNGEYETFQTINHHHMIY